MISCSEAIKQLWEYLDGTVDPTWPYRRTPVVVPAMLG
jgi:hypothetical protein